MVWIYAVLTLIQTPQEPDANTCSLDICRINSYSNYWDSEPEPRMFGYMPY